MSISALCPLIPIVPSMPAIQPGAAIVKCQGSLSVIVGCVVSFGASSIEPASTLPTAANSVRVKRENLVLMTRFYCPKRPNLRKISCPLVGYVSLVSVFLVLFVGADLGTIMRCLVRWVYRTLGLQQHRVFESGQKKDRPPDQRRPINLTSRRNSVSKNGPARPRPATAVPDCDSDWY